ncbi:MULTISPECIES: L-histidine N(alpha)-methyltransferase [unclassified Nodularia (in: cyanobacteria)]|uniref:L-histidine N(alpha)-methyltransferase n=1 Tax=unclassified Nodularia (in: cyanobacteria) TaxID=2656917 RepID=UPI00187DFCDB|nr:MULTISPECIES: L-histidine N(alpha)-methyltransferase [unclassified Nodularia (in: cyanobacteria)]MBE9202106.1 L-histidine N(alpha)-methyltransferase [Nodularia sp. LEGE 06071]MCC2695959.1 L-histidine N(alpha)-methyltransferase [Nodularia sp. LEGE 04288]
MTPQKIDSNSQVYSDISNSLNRIVEPSFEFYSIFSQEELVELIQALELRREFPLKYSYKGRGANIWNNFYQKYVVPKWYQTPNVETDLLKKNFEYINGDYQHCHKINIVDVGCGNFYPVKNFISQLDKLGKINKYIALDISQELLTLSKANFIKWFPSIKFNSSTFDIEASSIPADIWQNSTSLENNDIANVFLHLGVTIANHQDRNRVFQNFRNSMNKNDLLVFTNEIGSNSQWDGQVRGGCKYHVDGIYTWIKNEMRISSEDCELVRKYDVKTDSITAKIKFNQNYTLNFSKLGIYKQIEILKDEEITIWRHHKYEMPELIQDLEKAGLQLVHASHSKYLSPIMVICKVADA